MLHSICNIVPRPFSWQSINQWHQKGSQKLFCLVLSLSFSFGKRVIARTAVENVCFRIGSVLLFFALSGRNCAVEVCEGVCEIAANDSTSSPLPSLPIFGGWLRGTSDVHSIERLQAAKRTCFRTRPCSSWRYSIRVPWSFSDRSRIASTTISSPSSPINSAAAFHVSCSILKDVDRDYYDTSYSVRECDADPYALVRRYNKE